MAEPDFDDPGQHTVLVTTTAPVRIRIEPIPDERIVDGSCLGSFIGDRLVARCAIPTEALDRLLELNLFSDPVPLALLAAEQSPGLQCRLCALVPASLLAEEGDGSEAAEPWKGSVPSFEQTLAEEENADGEPELVAILLGNIVRFAGDRKHPDDLAREAADVLQKIVSGEPLRDADARAVDELLDSL